VRRRRGRRRRGGERRKSCGRSRRLLVLRCPNLQQLRVRVWLLLCSLHLPSMPIPNPWGSKNRDGRPCLPRRLRPLLPLVLLNRLVVAEKAGHPPLHHLIRVLLDPRTAGLPSLRRLQLWRHPHPNLHLAIWPPLQSSEMQDGPYSIQTTRRYHRLRVHVYHPHRQFLAAAHSHRRHRHLRCLHLLCLQDRLTNLHAHLPTNRVKAVNGERCHTPNKPPNTAQAHI